MSDGTVLRQYGDSYSGFVTEQMAVDSHAAAYWKNRRQTWGLVLHVRTAEGITASEKRRDARRAERAQAEESVTCAACGTAFRRGRDRSGKLSRRVTCNDTCEHALRAKRSNKRRAHCGRGHPTTDGHPNLHISPSGKRTCRACASARKKGYRRATTTTEETAP